MVPYDTGEKYCFVVSKESPLYPWHTSIENTLAVGRALGSDFQGFVSVEHDLIEVASLLKILLLYSRKLSSCSSVILETYELITQAAQ